jgi:hypothetical protein
VLVEQVTHDALRGPGSGLVVRVEEEVRPVARDDDGPGESLTRGVVEVERADALSQRHSLRFLVELDFDPPLVRFHEAE